MFKWFNQESKKPKIVNRGNALGKEIKDRYTYYEDAFKKELKKELNLSIDELNAFQLELHSGLRGYITTNYLNGIAPEEAAKNIKIGLILVKIVINI